jgi:uncharacterized protein
MQQGKGVAVAVVSVEGGVSLRVKVVPGASRSRVVGMLGDRLKLAVAAPPEDGKANKAVRELIAGILCVPTRDVAVSVGASNPQKTLMISGISPGQVVERLALLLAD